MWTSQRGATLVTDAAVQRIQSLLDSSKSYSAFESCLRSTYGKTNTSVENGVLGLS